MLSRTCWYRTCPRDNQCLYQEIDIANDTDVAFDVTNKHGVVNVDEYNNVCLSIVWYGGDYVNHRDENHMLQLLCFKILF